MLVLIVESDPMRAALYEGNVKHRHPKATVHTVSCLSEAKQLLGTNENITLACIRGVMVDRDAALIACG